MFERWYNSQGARDGPLGFGWTHSFNHFLRFYGVEDGQAKLAAWELAGATFGGGVASRLTGPFMTGNPGWAMQAAEAMISWPLTTATTAVGQRLGAGGAGNIPRSPSMAASPNLSSPVQGATRQNLTGFTQLPPLAGGSYPGSFLDLLGGQAGVLRSVHGK